MSKTGNEDKRSKKNSVEGGIEGNTISRFTVKGGTSYGVLQVTYSSGSPSYGGTIRLPAQLDSMDKIETRLWDSDGNVYFKLAVLDSGDEFSFVINSENDFNGKPTPKVWSTSRLDVKIVQTGVTEENGITYYDFDIIVKDI